MNTPIAPVILAGGTGSRLWPMSRSGYPKQFLKLVGDSTLLQETLDRVATDDFLAPYLICNEEHRFLAAEQLRIHGTEASEIALEPAGRNTAPAVALAALRLTQGGQDPLMLVMPADHVIEEPEAFREAVATAAAPAAQGWFVTFGVRPATAETGYGYIRSGRALEGDPDVHSVAEFVEKPDAATARRYLEAGSYLWNSGIFLFSAAGYLEELERWHPAMVEACRAAVREGQEQDVFYLPDREAFTASSSDSIDYALMERTERAAVVPVDMGWSDLGSWSAVAATQEPDAAGNTTRGDVMLHETRNSYVRSDAPLVAVAGLEGVTVVALDDAVLVADNDHLQSVKQLVNRIEADGREEHNLHTTVYRPWGSYRGIDRGERHQVKRITVAPGEQLSLQMHHHRAEHWIVVSGTAEVQREDETFLLRENESTFLSMGTVHRLRNPGRIELCLIEVQSGSYLGEDDIVRLEDGYGRTNG